MVFHIFICIKNNVYHTVFLKRFSTSDPQLRHVHKCLSEKVQLQGARCQLVQLHVQCMLVSS